jgi:hypothetical protein
MQKAPIRPAGWLSPADAERAPAMESEVTGVFGPSDVETYTYTPHGTSHFARVEDLVRALIPQRRWCRLSAQERMLLTWAAWTHDIGMHRLLYKGPPSDNHVRGEHVEGSAKWVLDRHDKLGLGIDEAQVLAQIIRFHSRRNELVDCPESRQCRGAYVRSRLLAAYLRLADALDVTHQRVGGHQYDRFPYLVEAARETSEDTVFHWVKSFVVSGIALRHRRQAIDIEFQFPKREEDAPEQYELLVRYVMDEIRSELQTVEDTLNEAGLSSFHLVTRAPDVRIDSFLNEEWPRQVPRVLNFLRMEYSPNSTEIALAALDEIDQAAQAYEGVDSKDSHARDQLIASLVQLDAKFLARRSKRKCHNALHRIIDFVEEQHGRLRRDKGTTPEVASELRRFVQHFRSLIGPDQDAATVRSSHFWTRLNELSPLDANQREFVLFGCSDSVISVLADKPKGLKLVLWIAECRPKSEHGPYNTRKYLDGERYAEMIHERLQSKDARLLDDVCINLIPDASVATLLDRASSETARRSEKLAALTRVDAVLFGTNGIYLEPRPCVAHTAGHLGIAMIAKTSKVPVVVVASALKIQRALEDAWEDSLRNTNGEWLTKDPEVLERLRTYHVDLSWNLREDHVPLDYLSEIITEHGCITIGMTSDVETESTVRDSLLRISGNVDAGLAGSPTPCARNGVPLDERSSP